MAAFYIHLWKLPINIVFPILVLVFFALNFIVQTKLNHSKPVKAFFTSAILTLLLAYTLWILDRTNVLCSLESPFQGHALWHILDAISILLVYLYYRSEEYQPVSE
jgi:hypothetical protein